MELYREAQLWSVKYVGQRAASILCVLLVWLGESILQAFSEANLLPLGLQLLEILYDCRHDLEQVSDDSAQLVHLEPSRMTMGRLIAKPRPTYGSVHVMGDGLLFTGFSKSDFGVFERSKTMIETDEIRSERENLDRKLKLLAENLQTDMQSLDPRFRPYRSRYRLYRRNQSITSQRLTFAFDTPYTQHAQLSVEIYYDHLIVFLYVPPNEPCRSALSLFLKAHPDLAVALFNRLDAKHAYVNTLAGQSFTRLNVGIVRDIAEKLSGLSTWFVMAEHFERSESSIHGKAQFAERVMETFRRLLPLFLAAEGERSVAMKLAASLSEEHRKHVASVEPAKNQPALGPMLYVMIREAAEKIGGRMTAAQILEYISDKYPDANPESIRNLIRAYTVNNLRRITPYPENQRPRIYDPRYDVFYQPKKGVGAVELYDPRSHGYWAIVATGTVENKYGLEVVFSETAPPVSLVPRESSSSASKSEVETRTVEKPPPPEGLQERLEYDEPVSAFPRNPRVVEWVNAVEASKCQICGKAIELPDGSRSVDIHHVWPLGYPHNGYELGYDLVDNVLCLCPNHHREMQLGIFYIQPDTYRIVYHDESNEFNGRTMLNHPQHRIGSRFLEYHRKTFFDRWSST